MNIQNGALAPTGSACLEKVLSRLEKVKTTGRNKWMACCPAHDDRNPSLGIGEGNDGRVLLNCWAGCTAAEVVEAIGLELRDLFPDDGRYQGRPVRRGPSPNAVAIERSIVELGNKLMGPLKENDLQRYVLAQRRLEGLQ